MSLNWNTILAVLQYNHARLENFRPPVRTSDIIDQSVLLVKPSFLQLPPNIYSRLSRLPRISRRCDESRTFKSSSAKKDTKNWANFSMEDSDSWSYTRSVSAIRANLKSTCIIRYVIVVLRIKNIPETNDIYSYHCVQSRCEMLPVCKRWLSIK